MFINGIYYDFSKKIENGKIVIILENEKEIIKGNFNVVKFCREAVFKSLTHIKIKGDCLKIMVDERKIKNYYSYGSGFRGYNSCNPYYECNISRTNKQIIRR
jgi:hypothetical protein